MGEWAKKLDKQQTAYRFSSACCPCRPPSCLPEPLLTAASTYDSDRGSCASDSPLDPVPGSGHETRAICAAGCVLFSLTLERYLVRIASDSAHDAERSTGVFPADGFHVTSRPGCRPEIRDAQQSSAPPTKFSGLGLRLFTT